MFVQYFCDYQPETLGECLYRGYLHPLACFEVLIPSCMYSLLGAAFVVNHLALSETDSLGRPEHPTAGTLPSVQIAGDQARSSFLCPVWSFLSWKTCTFKCKAHSTHIRIHAKKGSPSWPARKTSCCFKCFGKKSSRQKPNPETNYSNAL